MFTVKLSTYQSDGLLVTEMVEVARPKVFRRARRPTTMLLKVGGDMNDVISMANHAEIIIENSNSKTVERFTAEKDYFEHEAWPSLTEVENMLNKMMDKDAVILHVAFDPELLLNFLIHSSGDKKKRKSVARLAWRFYRLVTEHDDTEKPASDTSKVHEEFSSLYFAGMTVGRKKSTTATERAKEFMSNMESIIEQRN
jgi:hypothetical protein